LFPSGQRGQSTVELALCLPIVALLVALVVQVGVVTVNNARLWHAAREGARAAAVTDDLDEIRAAAEAAGVRPIDVLVTPEATDRAQGSPVTVSVRHRPSLTLPVLGRFLDDLTLEAEATMRIETP
jgi:Flp pilus assembly protein TadG